jgi:hypothetical protein
MFKTRLTINFLGEKKTRIEGLPEVYQQLTIGSNLDYIELDLILKIWN